MSPLQLTQIPPEVEALLTSEFAFVVLLGISVLEGAMLLRFMPSELVVPTALVLIGSSITDAIMIVLITVVGTTIGQFLLFSLVRHGGHHRLKS